MPTREEMRSLAHDIVRSYEDRIAGIAQLRATVKTDLREFADSRIAMGRELRADLAKGEEERLREARALKQELVRGVAERKSDVSTMLKGLDDAHAAMSRELKADLAKVAPALRETEAERQRTDAREIAQRKSDVSTMLREFHEEQAGVRDEWQKLTATMQAKRGMPGVEVKPPEAVVPPPVEEVAEDEAVARAEVAEVTPEIAALEDRVFERLANHPDGTRLVELEQEFGVARIQMARVLKSLMNENKVGKREGLYFAI